MAVNRIQSFLDQLSKNKNVQSVVNEFTRLGEEVKKRSLEINETLTHRSEAAQKDAHKRVQAALKAVKSAQSQLDREVELAVKKIRLSAGKMEAGLEQYRKRAVAQKNRLEKMILARTKSAKKTTKKRAGGTKKKARKTAKRA